jgi:hypothetical protein
LTNNRELLEQIAEALLERETLDREEIDLLAAGEKLPEAKLVARAREFAETLRREISTGATGNEPAGSAEGQRALADGRKSEVEVPVSAEREADATS